MSIDIKSWAKKYKELTDSDETIRLWQNIILVLSYLIWGC